MMIPELRPYQLKAVADVREATRHVGAALLVSPTGSGKTVCGSDILHKVAAAGRHGLFLAPRLELIDQASRKLDDFGLDHGVIMADHWRKRRHLPIQVASVPTLHRRNDRPPADVVLADEAHGSLSPSYRSILDHYLSQGAKVIGLTATPIPGLGDLYQRMIIVAQTHELIAQGYLVPIETFVPEDPALAGVTVRRGDYDQPELARAMDRPALVGNIVETWLRMARGRTSVVFAVNKTHARNIVTEFEHAGVSVGYLDDETPHGERREMQGRIASGDVTVIVNVGVLALGWDMPRVSCVVMARPTLSTALYLQQVGRGSRPYPGKESLIVLDHAGNFWRHGLPEEPREYSLDMRKKRSSERVAGLRVCPFPCGAANRAGAILCRLCRQPFPVQERRLIFREGQLVNADGTTAAKETSTWGKNVEPQEMARLFSKWMLFAQLKKRSPGQAFIIFRNSFGANPDESMVARASRIVFPMCLVPDARCRHCGSEQADAIPSYPPYAGQVICRKCYRGLAWVPAEWSPLMQAQPQEIAS